MSAIPASFVTLILVLTSPLHAADLEGRSRLGAVFAAPVAPVVVVEEAPRALRAFPSPKVPGYYGSAGDFQYRNYYGTSPVTIFSRLPYACGFHGYC